MKVHAAIYLSLSLVSLGALVSFQNCDSNLKRADRGASAFASLASCRLVDTRPDSANTAAAKYTKGLLREGRWTTIDLAGACGLPDRNAVAIAVNYTLLEQTGPLPEDNIMGAISIIPVTLPLPRTPKTVTAMWDEANKVMTNYTVLQVSEDMKIAVYPNFQTHLIIDVVGYYHY